jgi:hypothetical protein
MKKYLIILQPLFETIIIQLLALIAFYLIDANYLIEVQLYGVLFSVVAIIAAYIICAFKKRFT